MLLLAGCGKSSDDTKAGAIEPDPSLPPLPIEEIGKIETLPASFPESWMFIDEANFWTMFGGKVILLDVAEPNPASRIKGLVDKSLIGNFVAAKKRSEIYVVETFHARGSRGKRTDLLAIYDKVSLSLIKEIVLPIGRLTALPLRYSMALSSDERFLYTANFNPAASFNVVDLEKQKIVGKIETPGCVLVYPSATRNISSICADGSILTTKINNRGKIVSQTRGESFFDSVESPVFERPAIIGDLAYLPSFDGTMHVLDLSGDVATHVEQWDMVTEEERAANMRPSGLGLIDHDEQGNIYVIFQKDGAEGTHQQGGSQVWVFDPNKKQRISVIEIPNWAIGLGVTRGAQPHLITTNGELNLDVFDASTGDFLHTISEFGNVTPLFIHKAY